MNHTHVRVGDVTEDVYGDRSNDNETFSESSSDNEKSDGLGIVEKKMKFGRTKSDCDVDNWWNK